MINKWQYHFHYRHRRSLRHGCWVMFSFSFYAPLQQSIFGGKSAKLTTDQSLRANPNTHARTNKHTHRYSNIAKLCVSSLKQDPNCQSEHHSVTLLDCTVYWFSIPSTAYSSRHELFNCMELPAPSQMNRKLLRTENQLKIMVIFLLNQVLKIETETTAHVVITLFVCFF